MKHPLQCSGTPLNDQFYKMITLEIRLLWFSPKSMSMYYGSQNLDHLESKTTLHGLDGGLISEVPLYIIKCLDRFDNSLVMPTSDWEAHISVIIVCSVPTHRASA